MESHKINVPNHQPVMGSYMMENNPRWCHPAMFVGLKKIVSKDIVSKSHVPVTTNQIFFW
jgi:hypothetical protein